MRWSGRLATVVTSMPRSSVTPELPRGHAISQRARYSIERFLKIEAASGIVLVIAAIIALGWANSWLAESYHALWSMPVTLEIGSFTVSRTLQFFVNDGLMTVFFLVIGMEIRREMHDGALSDLNQASLPIIAALGGVAVPALIYLSLNSGPPAANGWAIPTATDIAFAVGVLSLLGRGIPSNIRIFLLTLAIIDDVVAVLIIAFFYSGGLEWTGFLVAGFGIMLIFVFQWLGIWAAHVYILPGAIIWLGLLVTGAHPTLAGVVLGLMTPVISRPAPTRPADTLVAVSRELAEGEGARDAEDQAASLRVLREAQRELLPPVIRVQAALHPWVAFGIMPLFALANAGVSLGGVDLGAAEQQMIAVGVGVALVLGKPVGVLSISWLAVTLGLSRLPPGVTWPGLLLVGLLAGIGFTMSIFIAMLAFDSEALQAAAKIGVLAGSLIAAVGGLLWGAFYLRMTNRPPPRT